MLDRLEALEKAATPGPWKVQLHGSGSTNVLMRVGDGANEYGGGMLYASIILYNAGAYSDGMDEDGVQAERYRCAKLIADARNALPALIAVANAAEVRFERGHDDTCSHALVEYYDCTCGHDELGVALAQLKGQA